MGKGIRISSGCVLLLLFASVPPVYADKKTAHYLYNEGIRRYVLKQYKQALVNLEAAYRLDPENEYIKRLYINALLKQAYQEYSRGYLESAELRYSKVLRLLGGDAELEEKIDRIRREIKRKRAALLDERKAARNAAANRDPRQAAHPGAERPGPGSRSSYSHPPASRPGGTTVVRPAPTHQHFKIINRIPTPHGSQAIDIERFLQEQGRQNRALLREVLEAAQRDRVRVQQNLEALARLQNRDRREFNASLKLMIGGGIVIALIITLALAIVSQRRVVVSTPRYETPSPGQPPQSSSPDWSVADEKAQRRKQKKDRRELERKHKAGPAPEQAAAEADLARAERLHGLYREYAAGNVSWNDMRRKIGQLERETRSGVLDIVEERVSPSASDRNAFQVLTPLLDDEDPALRRRAQGMVRQLAVVDGAHVDNTPIEPLTGDKDLELPRLLQIAKQVDRHSGRCDHSLHVADLAARLAQELDGVGLDADLVRRVALVHDAGILSLDKAVLTHPARLERKAMAHVQQHPVKGKDVLGHPALPAPFFQGIRLHHERLDGSGYPDGMRGNEIPMIARIIAVADVFDALTNPRSWREAFSLDTALEMLRADAGNKFDPRVVDAVCRLYGKQGLPGAVA